MKKILLCTFMTVILAGNSEAAKWKELVFADDVNLGMAELTQYCMLNNITVADVLWANSVESTDIKPGQSIYLPANQADLLAIWQNKGAWQPKALIPVTSAAAAKRAVNKDSKLAEVPMPKIAGIPDLETLNAKPSAPEPVKAVTPEPVKAVTPEPVKDVAAESAQAKTEAHPSAEQPAEKSNDDIIAMLREEVKTDERNLPPEPLQAEKLQPDSSQPETLQAETAKAETLQPETAQAMKPESIPAKTVTLQTSPAPLQPVKTAKNKSESPANVIAKTAKPDKILTSKPRKTAKQEIPGLMDPIIILSPNGDPTKGPMRLVISGDKVEVVQLPKNAAPKKPSMSDLNYVFGTNPSYLPHYNLTPKKRDPFVLNMGNLKGKLLWPVDGKISSPFGKWRGSHRHQGIDIPMPAGTPIRASRNGVVTRTGNNSTMGFRGYGNFVLMDHGDGLQTFYAHCLSVAVVQGQRVMQGQIIGYVGSTGRSTANHLHFEVRVNSTKVDPVPYLAGNTNLAANK